MRIENTRRKIFSRPGFELRSTLTLKFSVLPVSYADPHFVVLPFTCLAKVSQQFLKVFKVNGQNLTSLFPCRLNGSEVIDMMLGWCFLFIFLRFKLAFSVYFVYFVCKKLNLLLILLRILVSSGGWSQWGTDSLF